MKFFQKIASSSFICPLKNGTLGFRIYLNNIKKAYVNISLSKMQLKF